MSIATQITRLSGLRDSIRTKLIGLGLLPSGSTADLEDCKDAIVGIELQSKTVSPSTSSQTVTPDSGKLGLSQVTVNAATLQSKTVTSNQTVTPSTGYYGLSSVTVNVPASQIVKRYSVASSSYSMAANTSRWAEIPVYTTTYPSSSYTFCGVESFIIAPWQVTPTWYDNGGTTAAQVIVLDGTTLKIRISTQYYQTAVSNAQVICTLVYRRN